MTIEEEFIKEICPYCKGICNTGITRLCDGSGVKCVDYERDKERR